MALRACLAALLLACALGNQPCSQHGDKRSCKALRKAGCKWKGGSCTGTVDLNLYCAKGFRKKARKSEAKAIRWCEDQEERCQLDVAQPELSCVQRIAPPDFYTFRWATDPFAACPAQCGTTEHHQQREVRCEAVLNDEIVFAYADSSRCPDHGRPEPQRLCPATSPCEHHYRWHAPAFRPCQAGCGLAEATQRRAVSCQPNGVAVAGLMIPAEWCEGEDRPSEVQVCPATEECYEAEWLVAPFAPCPSECGHRPARLAREVRCVAGPNQRARPDADCGHLSRPRDTRECPATQECLTHRWVAEEFAECLTACGQERTTIRRDVSCYEFHNGRRSFRTDHHPCMDAQQVRPPIERSCPMTLPCLSFSWEPLKWSGCPWDARDEASCGEAARETRTLRCRAHDATNDIPLGLVDLTRCGGQARPEETRDCPVVTCEPRVVHAHGGIVDLSGGTPVVIMPTSPPQPQAVTDDCEDDPTWQHVSVSGEVHGCAFYDTPIMRHFCTEYLTDFDLGADGRWPDEGCPRACGVCSTRQHGVYHREVATTVDGHSLMCPVGDGRESIRHGYEDLSECVEMCNGCDGCVGFVDYHQYEQWFCVFKSSEATLALSDTHKDYYRRP